MMTDVERDFALYDVEKEIARLKEEKHDKKIKMPLIDRRWRWLAARVHHYGAPIEDARLMPDRYDEAGSYPLTYCLPAAAKI
jgi:hypothetical protein